MRGRAIRPIVALGLSLFVAFVPASAGAEVRCWKHKPLEFDIARAVKAERVSHGRSYLRLDPELSRVARAHSQDMAERARLYHSSTRVLVNRLTNWEEVGENVGKGDLDHDGADYTRAFMRSPLHRANVLLRGWKSIGVGVARRDGQRYVTVLFEQGWNPGTSLPMPDPC